MLLLAAYDSRMGKTRLYRASSLTVRAFISLALGKSRVTLPLRMGSSEGIEGSGEGCRKKRFVSVVSWIVGVEWSRLDSISRGSDVQTIKQSPTLHDLPH
jgi:hypothetical protein